MSEQLNLEEAIRRRDAGIKQVQRGSVDWSYQAKVCVQALPQHSEWTGEDIRLHVTKQVGPPHHHNAWGALVRSLVTSGVLVATGEWRRMQTPKSHARQTPVYRRA